jgi:hypothetical protein
MIATYSLLVYFLPSLPIHAPTKPHSGPHGPTLSFLSLSPPTHVTLHPRTHTQIHNFIACSPSPQPMDALFPSRTDGQGKSAPVVRVIGLWRECAGEGSLSPCWLIVLGRTPLSRALGRPARFPPTATPDLLLASPCPKQDGQLSRPSKALFARNTGPAASSS